MANRDPYMQNMYFILPEIKKILMRRIEREGLDSEGIIFGGAVRDHIISEAYTKRYMDVHHANKAKRYDSKKFWNVEHHPETAARTLLPDDLDIYFSKREQSEVFIESLRTMCTEQHMELEIEDSEEDPSRMSAEYGRVLNVRKASVTTSVGKIPFMHSGYEITVHIDIVTPRYAIMIQPPFCHLDFLCNAFIKTKQGIMYSNHSGTYIDTLPEIEKQVEVMKIYQDMIQFKTHFCRFEKINPRDVGLFGRNCYSLKRIQKLLAKELFPWTISNLPLQVAKATPDTLQNDCCICCQTLMLDERIIFMLKVKEGHEIKSALSHKDCFMEYLVSQKNQATNDHVEPRDTFKFMCPFRSEIDFTACDCKYKALT